MDELLSQACPLLSIIGKVGFSLSPLTFPRGLVMFGRSWTSPLYKNDQILAIDKEDFKKLSNLKVSSQWDLLNEQNLYDAELSLTNSLGKHFLNTFFSFYIFEFLISTYLVCRHKVSSQVFLGSSPKESCLLGGPSKKAIAKQPAQDFY